MTTISTLLLFAAAIILMVVAIARFKIHPFLSILGTALLLAILLGIPFADIPDVISKGFGGIASGIALVIIFGTLIGSVLERTGGAVALARSVERVIGKRHPRLAMMIIGWIVSIPVFCDSGFVLVSPIGKSLARRSGISPVPLMLALAAIVSRGKALPFADEEDAHEPMTVIYQTTEDDADEARKLVWNTIR